MDFIKYPKTLHIDGSKFELPKVGKAGAKGEKLSLAKESVLVLEEKMDGTQLGISFSSPGCLQFQSRGTVLSGGETEFARAKNWAYQHSQALWALLGLRYVLFGEWLYLKHTIFYDQLPDYFMEYDIYDRNSGCFLNTSSRMALLAGCPFIYSVKVMAQGRFTHSDQLIDYVGQSSFISASAVEVLRDIARQTAIAEEDLNKTSDTSGLMEGLYIKVENDSQVVSRYKLIRSDFIRKITLSGSHWKDRKPILNRLYYRDDNHFC